MAVPSDRRRLRMTELLLQEIALIIQTEVKDPRLTGMVSVVRVDLAADLKTAVVYVSVWSASEENLEADRRKDLEALRSARRFIMHLLAKRLDLRYVPELEFRIDRSMEKADRVNRLLRRRGGEEA